MKDADEFVSEGVEDNTTQTLRHYGEIVLASPAYSWFLLNLKKEANLISTEPNVMDAVKNSILSFLPLPRRFSRGSALPNFGVRFDVDWDPLSFFSRQFERQADDMLGSTLTLTGSFENAQAITCMKYMQQTWPSSGEHTVKLLSEAILKPGVWNECKLLDDTALFAQIFEAKLIVIVSGTRSAIAEIGEQLAWIPAALRLAPDNQGIYKCTPSIQYIRIEEHEHEASLPGALRSLDASFNLLFEISDLPTSRHSAGQCWHDLFKNPTIVQGYPVPRRARENTGLDIPLDIMADLVQAPQITTFEERLFLKGFSSMLVLMDQVEGLIIWHLDLNRSGTYISYTDASRPPTVQVMGIENIMDNIMKSRHIVGWCSNAKFYTGTNEASYPVKKPGALEDLNEKCILHEIKPPRMKYIEIPRGYHRADKEKPPYIPYGQDLHRRSLERLKDKYVNLWYVDSKRGWLVNGVSACLHLLRARLKHVLEDDDDDGPEIREPSMLNRYTVRSSLEFFKNAENMNLAVYPNGYQEEERPFTIMDQTGRFYNTLETSLNSRLPGLN
ncbi:hypothetical protein F4825DRAFT_109525 [Nemania diffusa]|nr:hypothetical protein F4825DRAFT_109525 [Nemania diffusa]